MTQVAHQELYPEPLQAVRVTARRQEEGLFSVRGAVATAVLATTALVGVNLYQAGAADGNNGVAVGENAELSVQRLALEPEQVTCDAIAAYGVNGTVPMNAIVADKKLPLGVVASIKDVVTADSFCPKSEDGIPATTIKELPGDTNGYQNYEVSIQTASITQNVQILPETLDGIVSSDTKSMKVVGGVLGIAGGGAAGVCTAATLGKQEKACDEFGNKFTSWSDTVHAQSNRTVQTIIIESVRKVATEDWEDVKQAIIQKYKDQAIEKAGGDPNAAEAVKVVFVGDGPDPNNDYLDGLRKKGVIDPEKSKDTIIDMSGIKITKQPPADATSKESKS